MLQRILLVTTNESLIGHLLQSPYVRIHSVSICRDYVAASFQTRAEQPSHVIVDMAAPVPAMAWAFLDRLWDSPDTVLIPALLLADRAQLSDAQLEIVSAREYDVIPGSMKPSALVREVTAWAGLSLKASA